MLRDFNLRKFLYEYFGGFFKITPIRRTIEYMMLAGNNLEGIQKLMDPTVSTQKKAITVVRLTCCTIALVTSEGSKYLPKNSTISEWMTVCCLTSTYIYGVIDRRRNPIDGLILFNLVRN